MEVLFCFLENDRLLKGGLDLCVRVSEWRAECERECVRLAVTRFHFSFSATSWGVCLIVVDDSSHAAHRPDELKPRREVDTSSSPREDLSRTCEDLSHDPLSMPMGQRQSLLNRARSAERGSAACLRAVGKGGLRRVAKRPADEKSDMDRRRCPQVS